MASNAGGRPPRAPRRRRAARASARSGHTHRARRMDSSRRMPVAPLARSTRSAPGRLRRPPPGRDTLIPSSSGTNCVMSEHWPAVTRSASGRPRPSQQRWILEVNPPRERPSHSSVIAPFFRPGQVGGGRPRRCGVPCVRRVQRRTVRVDVVSRLGLRLQRAQDLVPDASAAKAHESVIAGLPGAVTRWNVAPCSACAQAPHGCR